MSKKIEEVYVHIMVDPTDPSGDEGVPSFYSPGFNAHMPMMGADMDNVNSMRPIAESIAKSAKTRIRLVKFTNLEHVEWIEP